MIMISRRKFIVGVGLSGMGLAFPGCKSEPYVRPGRTYKLGSVAEFLYEKVNIPEKKFLVHRYKEGWAALSTRCTNMGCDLTYQEKFLLCPCCQSIFSHEGKVLRGPARRPLPWGKMFYENDQFFVDISQVVSSKERFTTDEIEQVIQEYNFKFRKPDEIDTTVTKIPDALVPKGEDPDMLRGDSMDDLGIEGLDKKPLKIRETKGK